MKRLTAILITSVAALSFAGCEKGPKPATETPQKPPVVLVPATSEGLPDGMRLVWNDEFDGTELDRTKWCSDYYSTIDYRNRDNWDDFQAGTLPQPAMRFTGSSVVLYTSDTEPERIYWPATGRKISSIQTYDWRADKNLMDNDMNGGSDFVGGYIEARIRRRADDDAGMVNCAFWLDSPGPDMRYYMESGNTAYGATGVRPRGQVFEIDLCENLTTEIVLHGNVAPDGTFQGNMGHFIIPGNYRDRWVVHSVLWTAAGLRFRVDGVQVAQSWNPHDIKSPDHAMNILLGTYGKGDVEMEVDYIRFYTWDLGGDGDGNGSGDGGSGSGFGELPNGGFEYSSDAIFPWEGAGAVDTETVRTGAGSLRIAAGGTVSQLLYLDPSGDYRLEFWSAGAGDASLTATVENIVPVSGTVLNKASLTVDAGVSGAGDGAGVSGAGVSGAGFSRSELSFATPTGAAGHKRTVKVTFANSGTGDVRIDDAKLVNVQ